MLPIVKTAVPVWVEVACAAHSSYIDCHGGIVVREQSCIAAGGKICKGCLVNGGALDLEGDWSRGQGAVDVHYRGGNLDGGCGCAAAIDRDLQYALIAGSSGPINCHAGARGCSAELDVSGSDRHGRGGVEGDAGRRHDVERGSCASTGCVIRKSLCIEPGFCYIGIEDAGLCFGNRDVSQCLRRRTDLYSRSG